MKTESLFNSEFCKIFKNTYVGEHLRRLVLKYVKAVTQKKFVNRRLLSKWNIKTVQTLMCTKLEFYTILSVNT